MKKKLCRQKMSGKNHKQTFRNLKFTSLALFATACSMYSTDVHALNVDNIVDQPNLVQQTDFIKGTIMDESGVPIIGANVIVKGSTIGAITDMDGNFSIRAKKGDVILVSYIGYTEYKVKITNNKPLSIVLREDSKSLEEVVVVGFGTQKKGSLATAISTVKSDVIQNKPVKSVAESLQGQVPGLKIVSTAAPGSKPSIQLRGHSSLNGGGSPLILVDGTPSDFNFLNPEDIESISVLKDAASSAIYGSRAANGVILVTTKRGKEGKPKFRYTGSIGVNTPSHMPTPVSSAIFAEKRNAAEAYKGRKPIYTQEDIELYRSGADPVGHPNTQWLDYVIGNALTTRHSLEVSGGTKDVKYLISAGYDHQTGVFPRFGQDVYNVRTSTDVNITKKLDFSFDLRYQLRNIESINGMSAKYTRLMQADPTMTAYNADGTYAFNPGFNTNPLVPIYEDGLHTHDLHEANGTFKINYKIIDGLKFTGIANVKFNFSQTADREKKLKYYNPATEETTFFGNNNYSEKRDFGAYYNIQALLNYNKKFGDHAIDVLGGFQQENAKNSWMSGARFGYPSDMIWQLNGGPKENMENAGTATHWALSSFIARANYEFKSRYILSASMRADASSRFTKGNRWATFPSVAVAWRLSSEEFMEKTSSFLDDLKLRASWGQSGSATGLGLYPSYTLINTGGVVLGNAFQPSATLGAIGNPDLGWEHSDMLNFGIDARLLHGRLGFVGEYYIKKTRDILIGLPVPLEYGFGKPLVNIGEVQNKGWELQVDWHDHINDFGYSISANISDNKNKVTDLAGTGPWKGGYTDEGLPFGSLYAYESMGLFQSDEEVENAPFQNKNTGAGDIRFVDQPTVDTDGDGILDAGDGKINADDRVVVGDRAPHYLYGFNFSFDYKGFDLGLQFQGLIKQDRIIKDDLVRPFYSTTLYEHQMDHWTPENRNAKYPRLLFKDDSNHNYVNSDFWLMNAGYMRLKNLTVGYTFPRSLIQNIGINNARVYFAANNLFTISDFVPGMDPESASSTAYPFCRTFTFGLNVEF